MAGALRYYSDRYYAQTVVLTHLDGNNGDLAASYPNLAHSDPTSIFSHAVGTLPACSTAQKLFGVTSLQLDKTQGQWIQVTDNANLQIGTGDFTAEIALYTGAPSAINVLWDFNQAFSGGGANAWGLYTQSSKFIFYSGSVHINAGSVATNTQQRITYDRRAGTGVMYIDGTSIGSWADGQTYNHGKILIGADPFPTADGTTGYIEEIRLTIGVSRYSGNHTVSNREFQNY